jgi:uncharacterized protein with von Willebrand factor type A (vWA) domain
MTPRLLSFIHLLRQHGVRVSVAESLDALHSLGHVGLYDRDLLRLSLRTTLVKSPQDFAIFEDLFERFFSVPRRRKRRRRRRRNGDSHTAGQHAAVQHGESPVHPALQPPRRPSSTPFPRLSTPEAPRAAAHEQTQTQELEALAEFEQAWLRQLEARPVRVPAEPHDPGSTVLHTRLDRPFPPDRLADMYREVERLAARLRTRRALRYRRVQHGRIDLRRTVVQSLRSGNEVPFTLAHRRRRMTKLRLIVLCDISGSVWHVSTFLLKLVHTLQEEFASVRSLLFVNSITEVTPLFRHMRFPEDLAALRHYPNVNLFGFSDFGRAFYQFYRDELGTLNRDTVLLILGDARNNNFDPQAWTLHEIRQRCRHILWLNPEPQREWNRGDSVLAAYAPACDHVLECWTLDHLAQAADRLLQT